MTELSRTWNGSSRRSRKWSCTSTSLGRHRRGRYSNWPAVTRTHRSPRTRRSCARSSSSGTSHTSPRCTYIFDIAGELGAEAARATLTHALEHPPAALVGFGLGGFEDRRPPYRDAFREVFRAATAAGLHSVPHAGETTGPETIWEALDGLGAERIGHGIRCLDDPTLLARLRDDRTPLEICPTSNVRTRQVPTLADHPLPRLLAEGLVVTLNSDDPPMFGTTLTNEYRMVAKTFGLSASDLADLSRAAVQAAFLDQPAKQQILTEIAVQQ